MRGPLPWHRSAIEPKVAFINGLDKIKRRGNMAATSSQAEVKGRFDYDPETGIFTDKTTGKPVGKADENGYLCVWFGGRTVGLHRLAFMWMLGHWPAHMVDHVNGNVADNRWGNLRLATPTQNAQNRKAIKSSHEAKGWHKGIKLTASGRYRVSIMVDGVAYNVPGSFDSASEAEAEYRKVASRMFGQFERTVGRATVDPPARDDKTAKSSQLEILMRRREVVMQQLHDIDKAIGALTRDAGGKTPELVSLKEFSSLRVKEKKERREAKLKQRMAAFAQLNKRHPLQQ